MLILAQICQGGPGLQSGDLWSPCLLIDLEDSGRFLKQVLVKNELSGFFLSITYLLVCPLVLPVSLMHQNISMLPSLQFSTFLLKVLKENVFTISVFWSSRAKAVESKRRLTTVIQLFHPCIPLIFLDEVPSGPGDVTVLGMHNKGLTFGFAWCRNRKEV